MRRLAARRQNRNAARRGPTIDSRLYPLTLLDRIEVPAVDYRDISSTRTEENSAAIRDRVQRAGEKQQTCFIPTRE